jgi:hypothetical protein
MNHRTARPTAEEREWMSELYRYMLNHGILIARNGLGALSTPMTPTDIDQFVACLLGGLKELRHERIGAEVR